MQRFYCRLACLVLIAGCSFAAGNTASAAVIDRSKLLQACNSHGHVGLADCDAYVAGVADASQSPDSGTPTLCIPAGVTVRHLRETVTAWLSAHAGNGSEPAAPAVRDALKSGYSCNK